MMIGRKYTLIPSDVLSSLVEQIKIQQVPEPARITILPVVQTLDLGSIKLNIDNLKDIQEMKMVSINGTLHITPYNQVSSSSYSHTLSDIVTDQLRSPTVVPVDKEEQLRIQKLQGGIKLLRQRLESQQKDIRAFQEHYTVTEFTFKQLLDTLEKSILDKDERDNALTIVQLASKALSNFEDTMGPVRQQYLDLKAEFNKLFDIVRIINQESQ
ncbi:hypothetical protein INT45_000902 [Circinella minor]|uniref:Uncharacterized protein n=1 Tax=Circinella minor TaxID=1195481 RepID=A0A8H7RTT8_9FUNG|nr:hypothetical protein INT45_000902 [Circinella minor]